MQQPSTETRVDDQLTHVFVELDAAEREKWARVISHELKNAENAITDVYERKEVLRNLQRLSKKLATPDHRRTFLSVLKRREDAAPLYVASIFLKAGMSSPFIDVLLMTPSAFAAPEEDDDTFPIFFSLTVAKLRANKMYVVEPDTFAADVLDGFSAIYEDLLTVSEWGEEDFEVKIADVDAVSNIWKQIVARRSATHGVFEARTGLPKEEQRTVDEHLTHVFVELDEARAGHWITVFNAELAKLPRVVVREDVSRATKEVLSHLITALRRQFKPSVMEFLSMITYEGIPWIILHAYFDQETPNHMYIDYIFRTPSSYERVDVRCAKNLLPTLFSLTAEKMSERHAFQNVVVERPFNVTVNILKQMLVDNPGIMDITRTSSDMTLHLMDVEAFNTLWKRRKHCAEPIAGFCGGCLQVAYCSKECAAENWAFHRHECLSKK
jgi:hypothetical protein